MEEVYVNKMNTSVHNHKKPNITDVVEVLCVPSPILLPSYRELTGVLKIVCIILMHTYVLLLSLYVLLNNL
jgi:hypothetical protein